MKKLSNAILYNKKTKHNQCYIYSFTAYPCNVIFSEYEVICYANNTDPNVSPHTCIWRFIKLISSYYDYGIVAQIPILTPYLCCDSKEDDWPLLYTNSEWSAHHNILVYLYR